MAKHTHTTPRQPAEQQPGTKAPRRLLPAGAALGQQPPADEKADVPATIEGMAVMEVVPYGTELQENLGTRAEWLAKTEPDYAALVTMTLVLQRDQDGLVELARDDGGKTAIAMHKWLQGLGEFYEAQAGLLNQAATRLLIGMARRSVQEGGA